MSSMFPAFEPAEPKRFMRKHRGALSAALVRTSTKGLALAGRAPDLRR